MVVSPKKRDQLLADIERLRVELTAALDALVADERQVATTIPDGVVRNMLTRGSGCLCGVMERVLSEQKDRAA